MANRQFSNDASSLLAGTINNTATVVQVSAGEGALFPTLTGSEYFIISVQDTTGNIEYMKCTAVSGDNLTVVRGQEGSTAIGFTANLARVELRNTAGTMAAMYQKDGDTLTGPMNLGTQTVTNGTLGTGIKIVAATEIVNTPIRGATGISTNEITVPTDGTSRAQAGGANILVVGDDLPVFTIGMIMAWNGSIVSPPTGWAPCDGGTHNAHVCPDLRDHFIVGAGSAYSLGQTGNLAVTTSSVSAGTPTINSHVLLAAEIATHVHPFDYFFANAVDVIGIPGFSAPGEYLFGGTGAASRRSFAGAPNTGGGGGHTHTTAALAAHAHTAQVGPYYALYYIMYVGT